MSLSSIAASLESEHRKLDELFGKFLAAGNPDSALHAIEEFDERLRAHTREEEERLYATQTTRRLLPAEGESETERLSRELRLEHVQIREVSGMMRRLLAEKRDFAAAHGLAANLARRWDAHTTREERELLPLLNRKTSES